MHIINLKNRKKTKSKTKQKVRSNANMMNGADSDMVEAPPQSSGEEAAGDFLPLARQLIDQGKPSQALQVVVRAMKYLGGDEAVLHALNRARQQYITKLQDTAAADELASLFAECAIAEALPSGSLPVPPRHWHTMAENPIDTDDHGNSILAETGRRKIVLDAFSDGSSFLCLQCGGLVSNQRRDEHYSYWCCNN